MASLTDFPEVIRKTEGTEGETFAFWLQRIVNKKATRNLMLARKDGFSAATDSDIPEGQVSIPVYLPLFDENTCIRFGLS